MTLKKHISPTVTEVPGPSSRVGTSGFQQHENTNNERLHNTRTNTSHSSIPFAFNGIPVFNPSENENFNQQNQGPPPNSSKLKIMIWKFSHICVKYMRFIGPGAMTAVAYIDPGNYAASVSSGAQYRYGLLFVMFISSCIAIFLQILAIRLGSVSGRDLAQLAHQHFPRWLNVILYLFAEAAIIATDIAEVVGTAVALNILFHIPLIVGVILTILDVLAILSFYRSGKSVKFIYYFEYGVAALVMGVVICFAVQLAKIPPTSVGQVFRGFIPSNVIFEKGAMYAACSILGATVMPHSLYLGSSIVKPRLYEKDMALGYITEPFSQDQLDDYRPSIKAINYSLNYSVTELAVSLFTFALFVNASILIVAGATLYGTSDANAADLYSIYDSLCRLLSKGSGILFMVALLLSGQSAGIVCTIAGQIVSEGHFNWKFKPWIRRVFTRCLAIIPCVAVSAAVGRSGISDVLNASQVALSILLPFLVLPLIYFTSVNSIMTVGYKQNGNDGSNANNSEEKGLKGKVAKSVEKLQQKTGISKVFKKRNEKDMAGGDIELVEQPGPNNSDENNNHEDANGAIDGDRDINDAPYKEFGRVGPIPNGPVSYANNWFFTILAVAIWLFIGLLNVYLIVQLGLGNSS